MPIVNYLQDAITKTNNYGRDFKGVFTDGTFMGFEIESFKNLQEYKISSPRKNNKQPALTFEIHSKLKAIDENDIITALIEKITTANSDYIYSAVSRQLNSSKIKDLNSKNLSRQLLAIPAILKITYENADRIIEGTVNKVNSQRKQKLENLKKTHKRKKSFDERKFQRIFNEMLVLATDQYIGSYINEANPIKLNEVEKSQSAYNNYKKENKFGLNAVNS